MNEPAVAIGYLERFAADFERESGNMSVPSLALSNGMKVAVVGSGPAGLSFAGDMAKRGYDVYVLKHCMRLVVCLSTEYLSSVFLTRLSTLR